MDVSPGDTMSAEIVYDRPTIVMAYIVMAYIVMAKIVTIGRLFLWPI